MTKNQDVIQLTRSDLWVPCIEAKQEAISVYSEFSMNIGCIEDISRLSHIVDNDFDQDVVKQHLDAETEHRLVLRHYLSGPLGSLASRMLLKAHVAHSMVIAEIDESAIGGYVVEPFVGKSILPELYDIYMKNRRDNR